MLHHTVINTEAAIWSNDLVAALANMPKPVLNQQPQFSVESANALTTTNLQTVSHH